MIHVNAKEKLLDGINKTADVVKSTLGYMGKTVMIQDPVRLGVNVTKDGVTVAKSVVLDDEIEALGSELIKKAALRTLSQVGDNTTTTCILTQKMAQMIKTELDLGKNYNELVSELKRDEEQVLDYISEKSMPVDCERDVYNIAYVSSNGDSEIASLFRDIYKVTGPDMIVDIRSSDASETSFETVSGYTMEQTGYVSPIFVNNLEKSTVEYNNPQVFIYDGRIKQISSDLYSILEKRNSDRNSQDYGPTVIICEDIDEAPLRDIYNAVRAEALFDVCVVRTNLIYTDRKGTFIDASQFLDAEYSTSGFGKAGTCERISISRDEVILMNGAGNPQKYIEALEKEYETSQNVFLGKRLFYLKSNAAVINVGGKLSTEISEKVDRIDDAYRAIKSSIEEGFVPGGSSVFLSAHKELDLETELMKQSLLECYKQLMYNAGLEPMYHLREINDKGFGYSYNLEENKVSNMLNDGIFDSAKGLRISVENAVSTAITFGNIDYILT